jgi:hypothetical protein
LKAAFVTGSIFCRRSRRPERVRNNAHTLACAGLESDNKGGTVSSGSRDDSATTRS